MNSSTFNENSSVLLPSETERRKIFYWLKRISSVTAWRRIFSYYQAWAVSAENSARVADENRLSDVTSLPQSEYALILKSLAHCEEGVSRLARGDKRVFKFDGNGEFIMARRMLSHWMQMFRRIEMGENIVSNQTPLWQEFCDSLHFLAEAWGECGPKLLESRYLEQPALVSYGPWLQKELEGMSFPEQIPSVPEPTNIVLVRTGQYTPHSGIWEPIEAAKPSFVSLMTGTSKPRGPFKLAGTMNYLHAGSKAPQVSVKTENDTVHIDTTWRLLWLDNRYEDGNVPVEEAGYRFSSPNVALPPPPVSSAASELVWAETGTAAPTGGKWLAESDLRVAVNVQAGERLPFHEGRSIRWVFANS